MNDNGGIVGLFIRQALALGLVDSKAGLLTLIRSGAAAYAVAWLASGGVERREVAFSRGLMQERLTGDGAR